MKILLFLVLVSIGSTVNAQVSLHEQEPNNTPITGNSFRGAMTIFGSMQEGDQDMFVWEVSDADADYLWELELDGLSDRLTKVDLFNLVLTEDGKEVTKVTKLFSLSNYGGLTPVKKSGLIFSAGTYYLGLSYAGESNSKQRTSPLIEDSLLKELGDEYIKENQKIDAIQVAEQDSYQVKIIKGKKLGSLSNKNNSKENPAKLREKSLYSIYFDDERKWLSISISDKQVQKYWEISGNVVIGESLQLNFYNTNTELLATTKSDKFGDFTLTDLNLIEGDYLLELISSENSVTSIELIDIGEVIQGSESEPNDYFQYANQFNIGQSITGKIAKSNEYDFYKFSINEQQSQNILEIKLTNSAENKIELCLYDEVKVQLQCKTKEGDINLVQLVLSQGTYGISIGRGPLEAQYELEVINQGTRNSLIEAEPNDKFVNATAMNPKRMIKGETLGSESDFFYFEVGESDQMWMVQAIGENITNLSLYNGAGKNIQEQRFPQGGKRVRLNNLNLMPGRYVVRVYGNNSKYLLRAFPIGPIDPTLEAEPNDSKNQAGVLTFNQTKKGLLQNLIDKDFYRFHLYNEQAIRLTIQPPVDGNIHYSLYWNGMKLGSKFSKNAETLEYKGLLQAGDYDLQLNAYKKASDDIYEIKLDYYDISSCKVDCEPNDTANQANLIQAPMILKGISGSHGDYDWYKLPALETESLVSFKNNLDNEDYSVRATINYDDSIQPIFDRNIKQTSFLIPANQESYYKISNAEQAYDWTVLINNKEAEKPEINQQISLQLQNLTQQVKAYHSQAQNLQAELIIENKGDQIQPFRIVANSTDYRWNFQLDENQQALAIGEKRTLPILIKVPANAVAHSKVRLSFVASDETTYLNQTWQDINVDISAPVIQPSEYWQIADELLGGLNVAATAMGSKRTEQDLAKNNDAVGSGFDKLFDGFTAVGLGLKYRGGRKTEQDFITIELAGDQLIDVKGILLNPISAAAPFQYLKDFDLHLSSDGEIFKSVLKGQVKSISAEQSFVLDEMVAAKYARLYILSTHDNRLKSNTGLGEWKVIARPTQSLGEGFNLANPDLGGYVAWASPETSGKWDINLLTEEQEKQKVRSVDTNEWQWVIGFHNQRAAKISKIQILQPQVEILTNSKLQLLKKVKVYASLNSNVGPWTLIAEKQLSDSNNLQELIFEKPLWARFVKFSASSVPIRNTAYLPETIRIFEQTVDENYQSILGEWGELSENAIYEKLYPVNFEPTRNDQNNNTKQTAIDLTQSKTVSGQVQLEYSDKPDWYKYQPKQGDNTLNISLSGKQNIETVIQVEDAEGNQVPLVKISNDINEIKYQLNIISNHEYFIKVEEPPRSVIFSWDTSGSTQAYEDIIYSAINSYSNGVIAGRDTVNFLPFGSGLLMQDWYGQPFYLKTILNNYQRLENSSHAEKSLFLASKELEKRQGSKSIIVITDAITGKYSKMWDSFRKVHPRIFSIGIIGNGFGGNPNRQIDLMQSWSRVNNGDFQQVVTATEVELAFARIANKLRQPADYSLTINSEFIKAPGPGKLEIKQDKSVQSSAVELILDASGSMLKRLNGTPRIDIAKQVLITAVSEIIPEKTPLALRVFGDKQANSCQTDLAIKLAPLNPNNAKDVINKIYAKNLAKTPIADSLAQVANDLKAHEGKKIVILVTDGEETCDGNPEQVIAKLIDDGIDIRLNIVGFAIDDHELKQQFNHWSAQGGGKYFDSNNPESLKQSVSQALKTPYSVYSLTDELIQEGVVNGDPIELPAGYYTIKVFANEVISFENYKISGETLQTISLDP